MDEEKKAVDTEEVDLDKLRDEKCFPVVQDILQDMAEDLIPEDSNEKVDYSTIVLKMLKHSIDKDLNVVMEVPYLFQIMLTVFSNLNTTVQSLAKEPVDERRYGAIAKEVLKIVADAKVPLGTRTPEEAVIDFADIKTRLEELFVTEKLNLNDIQYVMNKIFNSFKDAQTMYSRSLEDSVKRAEAKKFGLADFDELTVGKVDEVLKS